MGEGCDGWLWHEGSSLDRVQHIWISTKQFPAGWDRVYKKSADPTSRLSSSLGFFHSKLRRKPFLFIRWGRLDRNRNVTHPGPVSPDGFDCQRIKLYTTSSSRTVRALDKDLSDQKLQLKRWGFFNKGTMAPQQNTWTEKWPVFWTLSEKVIFLIPFPESARLKDSICFYFSCTEVMTKAHLVGDALVRCTRTPSLPPCEDSRSWEEAFGFERTGYVSIRK